MPTFSQSLEQSLHRALAIANERHHQYATLEHLLLSLIDDSDAAAVMRACSVDLDKLRASLVNYLETEFENLVTDGADDAKIVYWDRKANAVMQAAGRGANTGPFTFSRLLSAGGRYVTTSYAAPGGSLRYVARKDDKLVIAAIV